MIEKVKEFKYLGYVLIVMEDTLGTWKVKEKQKRGWYGIGVEGSSEGVGKEEWSSLTGW